MSEAMKALLAYQQADEDGVMVLTSRQAIHEVAERYETLDPGRPCSPAGGTTLAILAVLLLPISESNPDRIQAQAGMHHVGRSACASI